MDLFFFNPNEQMSPLVVNLSFYCWRDSQLDSKCNYSPIYPFMHQTAFLLQWNGKWRVVIVDQGRPAGGLVLGFWLWRPAAHGQLMCCSWWELKTVLFMKSTTAHSGCGGLPRANRTRAAPHQVISALCPGLQQASLSLKLSESDRWRRAWKAVTLEKSTSNKQLEHADTWG